jgi:VRR-NUC domain.
LKEKAIEQALIKAVKQKGGLCLKLVSPSLVGIPDRLILMDGGRVGFVEVKTTGKKPRSVQVKRMKQLQQLGFKVFVLDHLDDIPTHIDEIVGDDGEISCT